VVAVRAERTAQQLGQPRDVADVRTMPSVRNRSAITRMSKAIQLGMKWRRFCSNAAVLTELHVTVAAIASGGDKPRGKLRISAPLLFSQIAMGKLAAGFALKYPEVRLDITTEDRPVDMVEEGYDLIIRINPDPDESLVGRVFLRDRLIVVANPSLARPTNSPVPAVVWGSSGQIASWDVTTPTGKSRITVDPVLSLSSLVMVRDAIRAGVGVGRLPISLVSHDLAAGTFVHWGDVDGLDIAIWALYPSRRLLSARVSAFLDYLKEAFPMGTPEELAAFMK
jgi:DNA-binding transcriptional LysR family regulator